MFNIGNVVKVKEPVTREVSKYIRVGDICLNKEYIIMDIEGIGERYMLIDGSGYWWNPSVFVLVRKCS